MRCAFFLLFLFTNYWYNAQIPEFSICTIANPVPINSLKKCHRLTFTNENVLIQNFEVVFNSVQEIAMYTMVREDLNAELMEHFLKSKPKEIHLKIFTLENRVEKVYRVIPNLIKY